MLEKLSESLRAVFSKISNLSRVDKDTIDIIIKDLQRALLTGDVSYSLTISLTNEVKKRFLSEPPPSGMPYKEYLIKIIYDEISRILGEKHAIPLKKQKIMLVGLFGQGKTTTAGKLGYYFQKKQFNVGFIALDIHRPAAYDQLYQISEQIHAKFFGIRDSKDYLNILKRGLEYLKEVDVIIVDTAGRDALDEELSKELREVSRILQPDETILVIDAVIGQQAGKQAKTFKENVNITGVILTKMDGSAKGGGALTAVNEVKAPIYFIGTGEHLEDLEEFNPPRFVSRLLGMGDIQTLLEKFNATYNKKDIAKKLSKVSTGKFTLKDMYEQIESMNKMGSIDKLLSMIPGFSSKIDKSKLNETQDKLKLYRYIMDSMTVKELENPEIIKSDRITRIAKGSGTSSKEVKDLLNFYEMSKKASKNLMNDRKLRMVMEKQFKDMPDMPEK